MNRNDDSIDELNDGPDELGDLLRREASSDRPRFSEMLHQRVLQDIQRRSNWAANARRLAIAAAILIAVGVIAPWLVRSRQNPIQTQKEIVQVPTNPSNDSQNVQISNSQAVSLRFGDVVSARFSASGVTFDLPVVTKDPSLLQARASYSPSPAPASPQWVLAQMDGTAKDAAAAISEMIPTQIHELARFVKSQQ